MKAVPQVVPVPCLKDNYAYLIRCPETGLVGVIDPSEAAPILQELKERNWTLSAIFNTHHHWDHVGGNQELKTRFPDLRVYGFVSDRGRIPEQTEFLEDNQPVQFGACGGFILHNPGHTTGAITYVWGNTAFTGDTLFAAGCGRVFEGSPQEMLTSLQQKIAALPAETKLYFGHEYTQKNLEFALNIEPENPKIKARWTEVQVLRQQGKFTTPTTVALEWETNPFLRTDQPEVQESVRKLEPDNDLLPASVFHALREYKNRF